MGSNSSKVCYTFASLCPQELFLSYAPNLCWLWCSYNPNKYHNNDLEFVHALIQANVLQDVPNFKDTYTTIELDTFQTIRFKFFPNNHNANDDDDDDNPYSRPEYSEFHNFWNKPFKQICKDNTKINAEIILKDINKTKEWFYNRHNRNMPWFLSYLSRTYKRHPYHEYHENYQLTRFALNNNIPHYFDNYDLKKLDIFKLKNDFLQDENRYVLWYLYKNMSMENAIRLWCAIYPNSERLLGVCRKVEKEYKIIKATFSLGVDKIIIEYARNLETGY